MYEIHGPLGMQYSMAQISEDEIAGSVKLQVWATSTKQKS